MNSPIHYYMTIFPLEALIASQLDPSQFGIYMATGSKKGTAERLIFIELKEEFDGPFDWAYAHKHCVHHANGDPKHSKYLSVYRVLENVPLNYLGSLYLTTIDGRVLELVRGDPPAAPNKTYYLYQELCPIQPLVVSNQKPAAFGAGLCDQTNKVSVPKIAFADCKTPDLNDMENTGNIGTTFSRRRAHLLDCIASVSGTDAKPAKTFDRSHIASFTFQLINSGIYISGNEGIAFWAMLTVDELKRNHYDWGQSANIL